MHPKVFFFTVKDSKAKLQALMQTIKSHFLKKEKIHIIVPDNSTLQFVDDLLWGYKPESFLPHSTSVVLPYQDLIFLSLPLVTLEEYPVVFNLCQTPYSPIKSLKILYELEDLSHPQKAAAFQNKFEIYQNKGFSLCNTSVD